MRNYEDALPGIVLLVIVAVALVVAYIATKDEFRKASAPPPPLVLLKDTTGKEVRNIDGDVVRGCLLPAGTPVEFYREIVSYIVERWPVYYSVYSLPTPPANCPNARQVAFKGERPNFDWSWHYQSSVVRAEEWPTVQATHAESTATAVFVEEKLDEAMRKLAQATPEP